jgi:hypothetical protein
MFMKGNVLVLMVIAAACLPVAIFGKTGSFCITNRLDSLRSFRAKVGYSVTLPSSEREVHYDIEVATEASTADSLMPVTYHLKWQVETPMGRADGFSAYFDGHCYRYRDNRLLEYHYQWDSIPFLTADGGVQRNGQFVNLLPCSLARELRSMLADTTYSVTISDSKPSAEFATDCIEIRATQMINDLVGKEMEIVLDAADCRPLLVATLFNPCMPGEQEVVARYSYPASDCEVPAVSSEEELIALYPDTFEHCRVSNFSVENLRQRPLPGFALPTTTRERYLHQKGDDFASPTIIALLDPAVASTEQTIATLRQTIDRLPRQTDLILMFVSNDVDLIESLAGRLRVGETYLISAAPFARDCGVNAYPTFLLCDRRAVVADVIIGSSSQLAEQLLLNAALLK